MSELQSEGISVQVLPEGPILIHYERIFTDGLDMSGDLICDRPCLPWLVEHLVLAANDELTQEDADFPPDHLRVYTAGGHRYDDINVNVHNHRDPAAFRGKLYGLGGMPRVLARYLANQLRKLQ